MPIRCKKIDCKLNDAGWCMSEYIVINEDGKCSDYVSINSAILVDEDLIDEVDYDDKIPETKPKRRKR